MRSRNPTTPLSGLRGERRRGFSVFRLDSRAEKYMMTATLAISDGWKVPMPGTAIHRFTPSERLVWMPGMSTAMSSRTASPRAKTDSQRKVW